MLSVYTGASWASNRKTRRIISGVAPCSDPTGLNHGVRFRAESPLTSGVRTLCAGQSSSGSNGHPTGGKIYDH